MKKSENILGAKREKMKFKDLFLKSVIISSLLTFTDFIYKKLSESFIGYFFTSYDNENNATNESLISSLWEKLNIKKHILKPIKLKIVRGFEQSTVLSFIMSGIKSLLKYSISVYGIFLFSFGLYTAIVYFISVYAFNLKNTSIINLIFGIGLLLTAFPMLFVKTSLSQALCESRMMSFILFRVIGVRYESIQTDDTLSNGNVRNNVAFVYGMVLGLLSYFISPLYILLAIFGLLGAFTLLMIPEFGVVILFFATAFLPTMLIAGLIIYTFICYFLKLIRGKRTLKFELVDASVLLFMGLMLLGGVFSVSFSASIKPAMLYVCFMLGYFLVVNLIRTNEWLNKCVMSIVLSSFFVAIYGVYENYFGNLDKTWQDKELFESIEGRVISTFENPNVLAEYLIMTIPFAIALFLIKSKISEKIPFLIASGIGLACLIFTWSRGAWLGFLIGMVLFLLIYNKKAMLLLILGVFSIPFLPFVLPQNIIQRFTSIGSITDTSTSYRVNIWYAVIDMIKDHFSSGIGVGEGAFSVVYPEYSLAGIESAPHSHNLYLQIIVELGIFGLIVFLAAMIIFMQANFSLYNKIGIERKNKNERLLSAAGFCGIMSVLIQGLTDYIWYNYRVFFIFWLITALTLAVRRCTLSKLIEVKDVEPCVDIVYEKDNGRSDKKRGVV